MTTDKPKRRPPANNAKNVAAYRARRKDAGLSEVRGIFAQPEQHQAIKDAAVAIKAGIMRTPGPKI
jgi:hypothetical protein